MNVPPNENATEIVFTATTENAAGRANRLTLRILILLWGVFILWAVISVILRPPHPGEDAAATYTFLGICLATVPLLFGLIETLLPRGTWTFDTQGVEHLSRRGKRNFISWGEIDAVRWERASPAFRSDCRKITVFLSMMNSNERRETLDFIESRLKGEFDLRSMPYVKTSFLRWMWLCFAGVLCTGFILGPMTFYVVVWQHKLVHVGWSRAIGMLLLFIPVLILLAYLHFFVPKPPVWRERHQRYAVFDEPKD